MAVPRNTRLALHLLARITFGVLVFSLACARLSSRPIQTGSIQWRDALHQTAGWYASAEATRVAENLVLYQRNTGGWPKNIDMAVALSDKQRSELLREKAEIDSTIDNEATYTQLIFLARVHRATNAAQFREAFIKGFDYLIAAQYENGGWPQYYPIRKGYYQHITFNDDAMIGVMRLLRDVALRKPDYLFVDEKRRAQAQVAVDKGVECILKTQVLVQGKRTVWCAQHDEVTLAPAPARAYELISLSGQESVGIVEFLLALNTPTRA